MVTRTPRTPWYIVRPRCAAARSARPLNAGVRPLPYLYAIHDRAEGASTKELFGCTPVPPERDFKGPDLERGTGIRGAELRGEHLRLPGHGPEGPTLEIFNYNIDPEGNVLELQSRPR